MLAKMPVILGKVQCFVSGAGFSGCASGGCHRAEAVDPGSSTDLGTLSCSVAEGVTEGGVADGSANALAHCASTAPICGLGASAFGLNSIVVSETACVLGKDALKEVATKERPLIQMTATDLSALSCSVAGGATECAADGSTHALAHCAGTAPLCGLGVSTFGLVSAVVSKMGCDFGKTTIREVVAVEFTLIQVAATSLSTPSCSIAEDVTESDATHGSGNAVALAVDPSRCHEFGYAILLSCGGCDRQGRCR